MDGKRYTALMFSELASHLERAWRVWVIVLVLLCVGVVGYSMAFSPPANFPASAIVRIERGMSVSDITEILATERIISHPDILRILLRISGGNHVQAGPYLFTAPENLFTIAYRLVAGVYGLPPVRITFPEGETARDTTLRVTEAFPSVDASEFLSKAQPYEGYLFPDTYLFPPSADTDLILKTMRANFDAKIAPLKTEIAASGRSLNEVLTLASLIEKEARTSGARHMVSGILANRLRLGMPLQVDAVFGYIYSRDTYSPSFADLKVDSPYNTYKYKGLPPGPIGNPGLDSIDAALNPTTTDYLYYLTGTDGLMHYATTYAGHLANQKKYLK